MFIVFDFVGYSYDCVVCEYVSALCAVCFFMLWVVEDICSFAHGAYCLDVFVVVLMGHGIILS